MRVIVSLQNCRSRLGGFSLVEIITVTAVIAVLAAVLIPALGKSRQKALSAMSAANLRQSGSYLLMHAIESGNVLELKVGGPAAVDKMWTNIVGAMVIGEDAGEMQNKKKRLPSLDILYCPTFFPYRHDPTVAGSVWNWQSYGLFTMEKDDFAERIQDESNTTIYRINFAAAGKSGSHPLLMDSILLSGSQPAQRMSIWSYTASSASPGVHLRHDGMARAVFLDGSVRALDRADLKAIGFVNAISSDLKIVDLNEQ